MERKLKVYISKSNDAQLDDVIAVRNILNCYSNVTILEHKGGVYNPRLPFLADVVIVIPDTTNIISYIGKGIYDEGTVNKFAFFYHGANEIRRITQGVKANTEDWKHYGYFVTDKVEYNIPQILMLCLKERGISDDVTLEKKTNTNAGARIGGSTKRFYHLIED